MHCKPFSRHSLWRVMITFLHSFLWQKVVKHRRRMKRNKWGGFARKHRTWEIQHYSCVDWTREEENLWWERYTSNKVLNKEEKGIPLTKSWIRKREYRSLPSVVPFFQGFVLPFHASIHDEADVWLTGEQMQMFTVTHLLLLVKRNSLRCWLLQCRH